MASIKNALVLLHVYDHSISLHSKLSNARINPRADNAATAKSTMKGKLTRVGFNELLDFVHRSHSAVFNLASVILSFNVINAAWRCPLPNHQLSMLAGAQSMQLESAFKRNCDALDL